jgi:threonylcarbamoyladenosine tRNA methylthiotransferase MtaB
MSQELWSLENDFSAYFTHIFPYSKRDGTPAAKMPQVNGKIIKERGKILRETGARELQKFLAKQIGKNLSVILEKDGFGKSENFLDVKISHGKSGEIVKVRAEEVEENYLIG